jgi:hypothetical protein
MLVFQADVIQQATKGFATGTKVHSVITSFAATMLKPLIERYSIYPAKGTSIIKFAHNADQMIKVTQKVKTPKSGLLRCNLLSHVPK